MWKFKFILKFYKMNHENMAKQYNKTLTSDNGCNTDTAEMITMVVAPVHWAVGLFNINGISKACGHTHSGTRKIRNER